MESSWTSSMHAAESDRTEDSQPTRSQTAGGGTVPDVEQGAEDRDADAEGLGAEEPLLQGARPQHMGPIARLRAAAKRLKRRMTVLYYACKDPQLPWTSKLLAQLAVAYALSPIDLIPDFIPVLGLLDDLIILPGLIWLAVRFIPPSVMERAEYAAEHIPIRLQDNWKAALLVLLLWDSLAVLIVYFVCTRWGGAWLRDNWLAVAGPMAGALFVAEAIWAAGLMREHEQQAAAQRASNLAAAQELLGSQERGQQEAGALGGPELGDVNLVGAPVASFRVG